MEDSTQTPSSVEKLSYKFILDELKERQLRQSSHALPEDSTPPEILADAPVEVTRVTTEANPEPTATLFPLSELVLPEGKKYFRIGEVSDLIGVEAYVLRYWENEFRTVRPVKSKSGHRVYSAKDVRALHLIRHLLHVEKFSVKGAKKKLQELKRPPSTLEGLARQKQRDCLKQLASELKQLIHVARQNPGSL